MPEKRSRAAAISSPELELRPRSGSRARSRSRASSRPTSSASSGVVVRASAGSSRTTRGDAGAISPRKVPSRTSTCGLIVTSSPSDRAAAAARADAHVARCPLGERRDRARLTRLHEPGRDDRDVGSAPSRRPNRAASASGVSQRRRPERGQREPAATRRRSASGSFSSEPQPTAARVTASTHPECAQQRASPRRREPTRPARPAPPGSRRESHSSRPEPAARPRAGGPVTTSNCSARSCSGIGTRPAASASWSASAR